VTFCVLLAESVLQLLMEADVEGMIGAAGTNGPPRLNWRKRLPRQHARNRAWLAQPQAPELRAGSYPAGNGGAQDDGKGGLSPSSRRAWIRGRVSTRRVDRSRRR